MKPLVLGLVGTSFSGSTILELTLATHPRVTTVGEGWSLSEPEFSQRRWRVICSSCRSDDCPVFPRAEMPFPISEVHQRAADHADALWVVDSSKYRPHFDAVLGAGGVGGLAVAVVIKRPEPQIGSFLKHGLDITGEQMALTYNRWYGDVVSWLGSCQVPWMVMPYDEFTTDPGFSMSRVRAFMNYAAGLLSQPPLGPRFDLLHRAMDAHRIGGNASVVYTEERPILPDESWRTRDITIVPAADRCAMWQTYYRVLSMRRRGFCYG